MLEVQGIDVLYGDVQALWELSFRVEAGEVVTLLGANGAGKSTTLKAVSGLMHPARGSITFEGQRIDQMPPYALVERGMALIPEGRQLFPNMTVLENLELGAYAPVARARLTDTLREVFSLFPRLQERRFQKAGTLSGGEQQMCAIGRGLMSRPRLLLLDEPSLGLAPLLVQEVFRAVRQIAAAGVTVLLVEQNVPIALGVSHRGYVLETGRVTLSGRAADLLDDPRVQQKFLGV